MYPVMSRYATHAQSIGQLQPVVCRFFDFCLFPNRFWIYRQADNDNFLFMRISSWLSDSKIKN